MRQLAPLVCRPALVNLADKKSQGKRVHLNHCKRCKDELCDCSLCGCQTYQQLSEETFEAEPDTPPTPTNMQSWCDHIHLLSHTTIQCTVSIQSTGHSFDKLLAAAVTGHLHTGDSFMSYIRSRSGHHTLQFYSCDINIYTINYLPLQLQTACKIRSKPCKSKTIS